MTAFQAAYALGSWARQAGRPGRHQAGLRAGRAGWSVAAACHGATRTVVGFGAARFGLGLGEAGNFSRGREAVAEWFPKRQRALANGVSLRFERRGRARAAGRAVDHRAVRLAGGVRGARRARGRVAGRVGAAVRRPQRRAACRRRSWRSSGATRPSRRCRRSAGVSCYGTGRCGRSASATRSRPRSGGSTCTGCRASCTTGSRSTCCTWAGRWSWCTRPRRSAALAAGGCRRGSSARWVGQRRPQGGHAHLRRLRAASPGRAVDGPPVDGRGGHRLRRRGPPGLVGQPVRPGVGPVPRQAVASVVDSAAPVAR